MQSCACSILSVYEMSKGAEGLDGESTSSSSSQTMLSSLDDYETIRHGLGGWDCMGSNSKASHVRKFHYCNQVPLYQNFLTLYQNFLTFGTRIISLFM